MTGAAIRICLKERAKESASTHTLVPLVSRVSTRFIENLRDVRTGSRQKGRYTQVNTIAYIPSQWVLIIATVETSFRNTFVRHSFRRLLLSSSAGGKKNTRERWKDHCISTQFPCRNIIESRNKVTCNPWYCSKKNRRTGKSPTCRVSFASQFAGFLYFTES